MDRIDYYPIQANTWKSAYKKSNKTLSTIFALNSSTITNCALISHECNSNCILQSIANCLISDATTYRTHAEFENSPAYLIRCGYLIDDCEAWALFFSLCSHISF